MPSEKSDWSPPPGRGGVVEHEEAEVVVGDQGSNRGASAASRCRLRLASAQTDRTVRHRGMETRLMETILEFASVPPRKMETLLLGSWWP